MTPYEAKQEAKRARLLAAADRARERSDAAYTRADLREEVSGIPFGQPILVGHHSEGRHRRAIERADNAMRASIEADKRAKVLEQRADAVGTGGVSSDDPDAIAKLQAEVADMRRVQSYMVAANKVIRSAVKAGTRPDSVGFPAFAAALRATPGGDKVTDKHAAGMIEPDFAGRIGFAAYQLSNNGANIKRVEARIAILERAKAAADAAGGESKRTIYPGMCEVVENFDENRLQIIFDGKLAAETRSAMKSAGFRWAPSQGAWQRQLTNAARYAATRFLRAQGVEEDQQ